MGSLGVAPTLTKPGSRKTKPQTGIRDRRKRNHRRELGKRLSMTKRQRRNRRKKVGVRAYMSYYLLILLFNSLTKYPFIIETLRALDNKVK